MGNFLSSEPVETFSKDELTFLHQPSELLDLECPICLQVMAEPNIVSCCGHHFCGGCIAKSQKTSNFCPLCKGQSYTAMVDRGLQRRIHGLMVRCIYHNRSCTWVGELQHLSDHMNRRKREGECPYSDAPCVNGCGFKTERQALERHEKNNCQKRTVNCTYCQASGIYEVIVSSHLQTCPNYPIHCPNECKIEFKLPRRRMNSHLKDECPLVDVKCRYEWAGCEWVGYRGDLTVHEERSSNEHLEQVSTATKSLKEENKQLKKEISDLKTLHKHTVRELHKQSDTVNNLKSELEKLKLTITMTTKTPCQ